MNITIATTRTRILISTFLLLCSNNPWVATLQAQDKAAVKMAPSVTDIAAGKDITLEVKLNEPLPPESSVIARVRPEGVSQLIVLESSSPDDPSRTKLTLKRNLPNTVVPGKWTLEDVFIVLPGTNIWQPLGHNQLSFDVKGKPFPIPSKAEVAVK